MSHQYLPPKLCIGLNPDGTVPKYISFPTKRANPMQVGNQLQVPAYGNPIGVKETDRFQIFTAAGVEAPKYAPQGSNYYHNGQQWLYGPPQYSYENGVGDAILTANVDAITAEIMADRKAKREAKAKAEAAAAAAAAAPPPVPAPPYSAYLGRAPAPGYTWADYNIPVNAHPGYAAQRGWPAHPVGPHWQPTTFAYWAPEGEVIADPPLKSQEKAWIDHLQHRAAQRQVIYHFAAALLVMDIG